MEGKISLLARHLRDFLSRYPADALRYYQRSRDLHVAESRAAINGELVAGWGNLLIVPMIAVYDPLFDIDRPLLPS